MSNRITQKDLEYLVEYLNKAKGFVKPSYDTVGSYRLDYAYGGVKLVLVVNEYGSIRAVSTDGYGTKRQLYTFMQGMQEGVSLVHDTTN